jgi:hypothetical protein
MDEQAKLAKEADLIKAAAEMFGIAPDATVKVKKANGPWAIIRLDELVARMKKPKPPTPEK